MKRLLIMNCTRGLRSISHYDALSPKSGVEDARKKGTGALAAFHYSVGLLGHGHTQFYRPVMHGSKFRPNMLIRPNALADASAVHGCLAPPERPALLTSSGATNRRQQYRR